jgi:hypothetical protein
VHPTSVCWGAKGLQTTHIRAVSTIIHAV